MSSKQSEAVTLPVSPVRKDVYLPLAPAEAFQHFAGSLGEWWPFATVSVGTTNVASVHLEGHEGGRIFERWTNGEERPWGVIVVWNPPRRLRFSWHPGQDSHLAQEVELTFTPDGDGTRVQLEHRGWEKLGARAEEVREKYNKGWDLVFGGHFADFARRVR
jgi:uncharacterized protein YndB with AHSA1/START domain